MAKLIYKQQNRERKRPFMPWQVGDYDDRANYQFIIPYQTLLLCRLAEVTPKTLILDFLGIISCSNYKLKEHLQARALLADYFIAQGYGREYYTENDIRQMFAEMGALGSLFPWAAPPALLDAYCNWRDLHQDDWFKKWFNKGQRELVMSDEGER